VSALLDVNLLLACGWQTHAEHARALAWLGGETEFFTCPLVELGFIRVSMGPAFRASFADAVEALSAIKRRANARMIPVDLDATRLPPLSAHGDVTDAYLVSLAHEHGLQLATLDMPLTEKPWALGIAFRPFEKMAQG
jgi:toxin-antitoxin system PIN domain toxin